MYTIDIRYSVAKTGSMEFSDMELWRVSVAQKSAILHEGTRFGVIFNRPLIHFVQQRTKDEESL